MKKHLTAAGIERIKPPRQGTLEIFDLGYPGLALRVGHGGARSFEIFYRYEGKLKRKSLGRWPGVSLAQAREEWRKAREAIAKREAPSQHEGAKNPSLLFEHVAEEWLRRDQAKNKSSSLYQVTRSLEADLLPAWRGKRIDQIAKADIHALLDSIADRGAPVMARRVQAYVNRFFAWCIERDKIKADPTAGMPRVGINKSRDRVLTDGELAKVWRGADSIGLFGAATRLLILTGARREEITQLRWSEIDGDTITLKGERTKNGEPHIIPLSAPARELLAGLPRIGDFVFTVSGTKPINSWSQPKIKLDKVSGVTSWRIHDLRRTMATGMERLKIPLQVVEACLGHVSGSKAGIIGVYQRHNYSAEKRAALEAWAEHVSALVFPAQRTRPAHG
jgi:integrase